MLTNRRRLCFFARAKVFSSHTCQATGFFMCPRTWQHSLSALRVHTLFINTDMVSRKDLRTDSGCHVACLRGLALPLRLLPLQMTCPSLLFQSVECIRKSQVYSSCQSLSWQQDVDLRDAPRERMNDPNVNYSVNVYLSINDNLFHS